MKTPTTARWLPPLPYADRKAPVASASPCACPAWRRLLGPVLLWSLLLVLFFLMVPPFWRILPPFGASRWVAACFGGWFFFLKVPFRLLDGLRAPLTMGFPGVCPKKKRQRTWFSRSLSQKPPRTGIIKKRYAHWEVCCIDRMFAWGSQSKLSHDVHTNSKHDTHRIASSCVASCWDPLRFRSCHTDHPPK